MYTRGEEEQQTQERGCIVEAVVVVLNVRNFLSKIHRSVVVAASPGELQAARLCEEEVVCRRSSSSLDAASVDGDCIAASAEQRSKGSKAIYVVAAAHYTAHRR